MNSANLSPQLKGQFMHPDILSKIGNAVRRERLLDTATQLINVPSPTRNAGEVADTLARILERDGFEVERPTCAWDPAPAVVARLESGKPGRTLQYDGHLDTVHLPFIPAAVDGDRLTGSGSSDMKAGVAAAVEALRILRELGLPESGSVLFTAHDLHEAPWGDSAQLNEMIRSGICGDGVLIPEYTHDHLPVIGRGNAIVRIRIARKGPPVHEVFRPRDEPNVMLAGALFAQRFEQWNLELSKNTHPLLGSESAFLGNFQCGEIYNQFPSECRIEGTLRWFPSRDVAEIEQEFQNIIEEIRSTTGATVEGDFTLIRDGFELDTTHPLTQAFQQSQRAISGTELPTGAKPFVDDGSCFWKIRGLPAITHGPLGGGAHTLQEWVSITDLMRVAKIYAATAIEFCPN